MYFIKGTSQRRERSRYRHAGVDWAQGSFNHDRNRNADADRPDRSVDGSRAPQAVRRHRARDFLVDRRTCGLGHDVTLFASGDSRTSAKLEATWPKALRLDGTVRDPNALHMMMIEQVAESDEKSSIFCTSISTTILFHCSRGRTRLS